MGATEERAALLRAVLAEPDDDGVRLVYSDWLEEHGEPERAEFIRVQCRIWSEYGGDTIFCEKTRERVTSEQGKYTPRCRCKPCRLLRREWGLWRQHGCDWWGEVLRIFVESDIARSLATGVPIRRHTLAPLVRTGKFRRGLVHSLACSASDWLAHSDAIRAAHPVREVELTRLDGDDRELLMDRVFDRTWQCHDNPQLHSWTDRELLEFLFPDITFHLPAY